ncbi:hypothetical protein J4Q44_G00090500 [Coregonus suidteri]|uniref:Uncharacterized protein n=1 Tax=Coregonus suidteri TaxID=861788 RepID=A0AAN8LYJ8_9TELE
MRKVDSLSLGGEQAAKMLNKDSVPWEGRLTRSWSKTAKVSSVGGSEENCNLTVKEQHIQQFQHVEVMNSLQHAHQLLLTQTQAVSRVELALQAQRKEYQIRPFSVS